MSTGLILAVLLMTIILLCVVIITGPFRRILSYTMDLIIAFIIIFVVILSIVSVLSLLP